MSSKRHCRAEYKYTHTLSCGPARGSSFLRKRKKVLCRLSLASTRLGLDRWPIMQSATSSLAYFRSVTECTRKHLFKIEEERTKIEPGACRHSCPMPDAHCPLRAAVSAIRILQAQPSPLLTLRPQATDPRICVSSGKAISRLKSLLLCLPF